MRSLYWLTAVTLVAAAVATVAIADYGRRHPQTLAAWWGNAGQTTSIPVCCETTTESKPGWVTENMDGSKEYRKQQERAAILPPIIETAATADPVPTLPPSLEKPLRVEDVPEHQQIKEAALKDLAVLQPEAQAQTPVPPLPPSTQPPAAVAAPVVDEFTFSEKPLAPLYVPLQPDAKVILPPAKMMQEVAKLPSIPGVSLNTNGIPQTVETPSKAGFTAIPSYQVEPARGAEIMPGIHAAQPATSDFDNPVRDSILTFGELVSAMNPTTYMMSMPVQKKSDKPSAFATKEPKATPRFDTSVCNANFAPNGMLTTSNPATCKSSACCKEGTCCKEAAPGDDVVVRTYTIADLTATVGANRDELIELVTKMVAPDSWGTVDSNIVYYASGKCLVVRHRCSVQGQVEDMLSQLRGQVQKQSVALMPCPVVRHEPTALVPANLELVPLCPRECCERQPRVITNDPTRCTGDDEFFGMIPMTLDGRLMPVPMTLPKLQSSSLVPAQFEPKVNDPVWLEDGPASRNSKPRTPEFFPWFLPYAPLPNGPDSCEEELLKRVGFVNYTDDEIALLFLLACEWEEGR